MTWAMHDEEFRSVMCLTGPERYSYCVKKVADFEEIWGLWNAAGWAVAGNKRQDELVPVWPHSRFAAACASEAWSGYEPKAIGIHTWLERWVPGMLEDQRLVAVFPTPSGQGVLVSPDRFGEDLLQELSLYE